MRIFWGVWNLFSKAPSFDWVLGEVYLVSLIDRFILNLNNNLEIYILSNNSINNKKTFNNQYLLNLILIH